MSFLSELEAKIATVTGSITILFKLNRRKQILGYNIKAGIKLGNELIINKINSVNDLTLAQLKTWANKRNDVKTFVYGHNMCAPGDLYQLVYIRAPDNFTIIDNNDDLKTKLDQTVELITQGKVKTADFELKEGQVQGDIEGIYYNARWASDLTMEELSDLFDA